jgi:hypothetical protein
VNDLINPPSYSALGRYAQAKLALILLTLEQATDRYLEAAFGAMAISHSDTDWPYGGADATPRGV